MEKVDGNKEVGHCEEHANVAEFVRYSSSYVATQYDGDKR